MESNQTPPFGKHLMLEIYNCPSSVLSDANTLYRILDELPARIHMTKMTLPYIVFTPGNNEKDPGGWSGFVIIQESHISLHTFARRRFVTIDVYSCKDFDTEAAIAYLKKEFRSDDIEYNIESRGNRYPEENLE
jgi:S-adenosylmethionine decarboxylase